MSCLLFAPVLFLLLTPQLGKGLRSKLVVPSPDSEAAVSQTVRTAMGLPALNAAAMIDSSTEGKRDSPTTATLFDLPRLDHSADVSCVTPRAAASASVSSSAPTSDALRRAAEAVLPSVVTIHERTPALRSAEQQQQSDVSDEQDVNPLELLRRQLFDKPERQKRAIGSGVIIDASGIILTNSHVVSPGGVTMVWLNDGRQFRATEIKRDPYTDLAIIRIRDAGVLRAAELGDSGTVRIGDWVLAVGSPFGLSGAITVGIISAKDRTLGITRRDEFLQTDAAVNPGGSGGPLVNLRGQVVGVNTAISSMSGGHEGVAFAIPGNLAKWVARQLIEKGQVERGYLGAGLQRLTPELAGQLGVASSHGALITAVAPDSPAGKAGLRPGDLITRFGAQPIKDPRQLTGVLDRARIGSQHEVVALRSQREMTLRLTVARQQADSDEESTYSGPPQNYPDLGIHVEPLPQVLTARLGARGVRGVIVAAVDGGSPADEAGLTSGMVISHIGPKQVTDVASYRAAMKRVTALHSVLLLVHRPDGSAFLVIKRG